MTQLHIQPLDPDAEGSLDQYIELLDLTSDVEAARSTNDLRAMAAVLKQARRMVEMLATTDDGTPVADALKRVSLNDLMSILRRVMGENPVNPQKGEPLPSGSPEAAVPLPVGSTSS